jgi:fructokinase
VTNANSTCLIGHPLDRDLSEALKRPIRVANDANCFTLSEAIDGAGSDAASVFGVILGTGVGGGFVVDGAPLTGAQAIAGEWGHNPMPGLLNEEWVDRRCYCSRLNCIETFLSGSALAADHLRRGGNELTTEEIAEQARGGDDDARASIERYAERLARALTTVVNVVDPEVIVLGGGVSNITALYELVPPLLAEHVSRTPAARGCCRRSTEIPAGCVVRHGCGARTRWNQRSLGRRPRDRRSSAESLRRCHRIWEARRAR